MRKEIPSLTKKQEWKAEVSECPDSVLEAAAGATCRGKKKKSREKNKKREVRRAAAEKQVSTTGEWKTRGGWDDLQLKYST